MKKESFYIPSKCDDLRLFTTVFIPNKKPIGIIQFTHGMMEHQTYYYDLMEHFTEKNYVCIIHDHRGHGKSVYKDEDLGYFYEEKANYIVEDTHQITEYIKEKYPNIPLSLFGHSMGSLVVRKYLKKYDSEIDHLIVCGSPSKNVIAPLGLLLTKIYKIVMGERYRSKLLEHLALTPKKVDEWLTINYNYAREYEQDPHCSFTFTVNGFINLVQLMIDVYSKKDWNIQHSDLPILFVAGSDDIITKGEKNWKSSMKFLNGIGYTNIENILFSGCKHAVFMDDEKKFFQEVLQFIKK